MPAPSSPASVSRRPFLVVLFSVIACGLLVAAASVVPLVSKDGQGGLPGRPGDLEDTKVEPAAYALEATGEVSRLATLPALPGTGVAGLDGLSAAETAASAALQKELEAAVAELEAAIASAATTLPEVPQGYVAGADVHVDLPAAQGYPLPSMQVPDLGVDGILLQTTGVSNSPVGTGSGSPLGGILGQVETLGTQLEDLLADSPLGPLPVEGLPTDGLPLPGQAGSAPQQVHDADDTVEPDEEGALAASSHARSALQLTNASYATAAAELQALLDAYADLADRVEEALAEVQQVHDDAKAGIEEALQERLADIERQVAELQAKAEGLVELHAKAVSDARGVAAGAVAKSVAAQSATVAKAGETAVRDLERQVKAVEADAQQRRDAIAALVGEASAKLGSTPEGVEALQAVQAAAGAATLKLDRDAKAQVSALQAQATEVQGLVGRSQAGLQETAEEAVAELDAIAEEAVEGDAEALAYLQAQARSYGELMEARETELALKAVEQLEDLAERSSEDVVGDALSATRSARGSIDRAGDLVGQVQLTLSDQVGKDLDYVAKVGEDYGRVPTEDRKARATHWAGVAVGLAGSLEDALVRGRTVELLAEQALAAARQAEAEVAALA